MCGALTPFDRCACGLSKLTAGYNCRVSFRIDRRHWAVFLLLFLVNLIVLVVRIPAGAGIEIRIFLLMIACSALVAALTALLLVALFDKISRMSKTG